MAQPFDDAEPPVVAVTNVPHWSPAWAVPEVPVPESDTHDAAIEALRALLLAWVERTGRDVKVARNLGIRWHRKERRAGFDPDLCLIEPSPDRNKYLGSLQTWLPDHPAPMLAIEVVSPGHPYKDYIDTPERCAASGVTELWVFDPMLEGPRARGGPHLLQLWRRREDGFERRFAGAGAVFSPLLGAWLHPQASRLASGARLHLSDDAAGHARWLGAEEQARQEEGRARSEAQRARDGEREARTEAQRARDGEREARAALEQARSQYAVLEQRLRELDARAKKG